jgi:hypothetical protein
MSKVTLFAFHAVIEAQKLEEKGVAVPRDCGTGDFLRLTAASNGLASTSAPVEWLDCL